MYLYSLFSSFTELTLYTQIHVNVYHTENNHNCTFLIFLVFCSNCIFIINYWWRSLLVIRDTPYNKKKSWNFHTVEQTILPNNVISLIKVINHQASCFRSKVRSRSYFISHDSYRCSYLCGSRFYYRYNVSVIQIDEPS